MVVVPVISAGARAAGGPGEDMNPSFCGQCTYRLGGCLEPFGQDTWDGCTNDRVL